MESTGTGAKLLPRLSHRRVFLSCCLFGVGKKILRNKKEAKNEGEYPGNALKNTNRVVYDQYTSTSTSAKHKSRILISLTTIDIVMLTICQARRLSEF
jgi:hypothetical protein